MCSNTNIAGCYIKTLQSNLHHTTVWNHWSVKFNLHIQGSLSCKENEENMIYTNKQIRLNNLKKINMWKGFLWCLQYSFQVMTLLNNSKFRSLMQLCQIVHVTAVLSSRNWLTWVWLCVRPECQGMSAIKPAIVQITCLAIYIHLATKGGRTH